jgi:hypothetical protein
MKHMKKLTLAAILILQFVIASGQRSIDRLFDKYADREGFTSVNISGNLLNFAACLDNDDEIKARITEIRVLTQNDKSLNTDNFLDVVKRDLNDNDYEEFLRVKEYGRDLRMLVRSEGRKIKEFLLVSGGEENSLVQIKGDMTLADAKKLSENAKKHNDITISLGKH